MNKKIKDFLFLTITILAFVGTAMMPKGFDFWLYFENERIGWYSVKAPVVNNIIYDPYGELSYQELTNTLSTSVKIEMSGSAGSTSVSVKTGASLSISVSFSSSTRTIDSASLPNGPGVGDVVLYELLEYEGWLIGDFRYNPNLGIEIDHVDSFQIEKVTSIGDGALTRSQFMSHWSTITGILYQDKTKTSQIGTYMESFYCTLEDKTGTSGSYHRIITVGQGITKTYTYTVKIEANDYVELKVKIPLPGVKVECSCKVTYGTACSYTTKLYIKDTTQDLEFYIESDDTLTSSYVYDPIFWFNPMS
ncbi:MAG: hypothetical protein ACTSQE_10635 [Candidatus Heimdallarchaeaceae archaeon]